MDYIEDQLAKKGNEYASSIRWSPNPCFSVLGNIVDNVNEGTSKTNQDKLDLQRSFSLIDKVATVIGRELSLLGFASAATNKLNVKIERGIFLEMGIMLSHAGR